ncbi:hypothetical protein ACKWTF_008865 [Chironomus riparius]
MMLHLIKWEPIEDSQIISFFLSRYSKAPWAESKAFCKAFDLELLSFETLEESRAFISMADNNSILKKLSNVWLWTDGITLTKKSTTDCYWTKTGTKISFPMDWYPGQPSGSDQYCLCVSKRSAKTKFGFNDLQCYDSYTIVCQRVES